MIDRRCTCISQMITFDYLPRRQGEAFPCEKSASISAAPDLGNRGCTVCHDKYLPRRKCTKAESDQRLLCTGCTALDVRGRPLQPRRRSAFTDAYVMQPLEHVKRIHIIGNEAERSKCSCCGCRTGKEEVLNKVSECLDFLF